MAIEVDVMELDYRQQSEEHGRGSHDATTREKEDVSSTVRASQTAIG